MKKKWLIVVATTTMLANTAYAGWPTQENTKIYLGAEVGRDIGKMDSGGYNNSGFENENDDRDNENFYSVKVGTELGDKWRFDITYRDYEDHDYTTDSFLPPDPTFFYDSTIKSKAFMATVYYDFYNNGKLEFYGGAGAGISRTKVSTSDTVVEGSGSENNFAWQVELGVDYPLTDCLILNTGFRYVDLGKTKIDLDNDNGDFTADLSSEEVFLGLRYTF